MPLVVVLVASALPAPTIRHDALEIGPARVLAASPVASDAAGDTRSPGEGPGLVGRPLQAILGVLGVAILSALLTLSYVRLTGRRKSTERRS